MKHTIIILALFLSIASCKKPDGKISGIVTYYFNQNFGDKPDVGANIYVVPKEDFDSTKAKLISRYIQVKDLLNSVNRCKNIISSDSENNSISQKYGIKQDAEHSKTILSIKQEMERSQQDLTVFNINSKQDFDSLDNQAYRSCVAFRNEKNIKEFIADGNGACIQPIFNLALLCTHNV